LIHRRRIGFSVGAAAPAAIIALDALHVVPHAVHEELHNEGGELVVSVGGLLDGHRTHDDRNGAVHHKEICVCFRVCMGVSVYMCIRVHVHVHVDVHVCMPCVATDRNLV
jgi:hypothetical protein